MPAWFGHEIAENIAGAQLVALDSGGHMLPETRGSDLATAILGFLEQ